MECFIKIRTYATTIYIECWCVTTRNNTLPVALMRKFSKYCCPDFCSGLTSGKNNKPNSIIFFNYLGDREHPIFSTSTIPWCDRSNFDPRSHPTPYFCWGVTSGKNSNRSYAFPQYMCRGNSRCPYIYRTYALTLLVGCCSEW